MQKKLATADYVDLKTLVIEGEITSIQNDILDIQGDITTLSGNINSIEGDISSIQGNISSIGSELNKKADITFVTSSVSSHNVSNTSHQDIRNLIPSIIGLATESFVTSSISDHNLAIDSHTDIRDSVTNVSNSLSSYVPYNGATTNVDLGSNSLTSTDLTSLGQTVLASTSGNVLIGTVIDDGVNTLQVNGNTKFTGGDTTISLIQGQFIDAYAPDGTTPTDLTLNSNSTSPVCIGTCTTDGNSKLEVVGNIKLQSETTSEINSKDSNNASKPLALNVPGGNVLIGTTSDDSIFKLQVVGDIKVRSSDSLYGKIQSRDDSAVSLPLQVNPEGGNVLIGTATDDGVNKLQVNGNTSITGNLTATGNISSPNISSTTLTVDSLSANNQIILSDNKKLYFGTDKDTSITYESANNRIFINPNELNDQVNTRSVTISGGSLVLLAGSFSMQGDYCKTAGGAGGSTTFITGVGTNPTSAALNGSSGSITHYCATAGLNNSVKVGNNITGYNAGSFILNGSQGDGGASTNDGLAGTIATGGNGSIFQIGGISAGRGGTSSTTNLSGTNIGGNGGNLTIRSGTAGAGSNAALAQGGNGGNNITTLGTGGGAAGSTSLSAIGGAGGAGTFTAGNGGAATGGTQYRKGGEGGAFGFNAGNGGAASSLANAVGGVGGRIEFNAGNGGIASLGQGGSGGSITFKAGGPGTVAASAGSYGNILFNAGGLTLGKFDNSNSSSIGHFWLMSDNQKLKFAGTELSGATASIYYDGTNLQINPKELGTGYVNISGDLKADNLSASVSIATPSLSSGIAQFGTATDYTSFEADGTMFMSGSATIWEDLNFDPARSSGPVATRPAEVTIDNCFYVEFASSNNQTCGAVQELPHDYKLSSDLYPHAHIFLKNGETSGTTGATFTMYWRLSQSTGTTTGSTILSASSAELNTTSGANKLDLFDASFAGSAELGGQLALTIARTAGNAGDIIVTTYGCHYEADAIGSRTISSK